MTNMLNNALGQVARPLQDFMKKLAGSDGQIWLEAFKKFLRKENPWDTTVIALVPLGKMDDVCICENVKELFNGDLGTIYKIKTVNLTTSLNDNQIIGTYGDDILFDSVDALEATIADLISKQPGGKLGKLFNNGYANIFYVRVNGKVRCIRVSWSDDKWCLDSSRILSDYWDNDDCVFCSCGPLDT